MVSRCIKRFQYTKKVVYNLDDLEIRLLSRRQGKAEAAGSHGATEPKRSRAVVSLKWIQWDMSGAFMGDLVGD